MFSGDFDPRPKTIEIWERTEKTRLCVTDILDDNFLRNQSSTYLLDFYFYLTHSFPMHPFSIPENIESFTLF